ncbi:MAG: hypothetical protein AB1728_09750 [Bacteroidota bacterium]
MKPYNQRFEFFRLASSYYITARFALFNDILLVSANLFHHSIEMFLKGLLSPNLSLDALKKMNHNLSGLWTNLKSNHPSENLNTFDSIIIELDKFEGLRYPDKVLQAEIIIMDKLADERGILLSGTNDGDLRYRLYLDEIDRLIKRLFVLGNLSPSNLFDTEFVDIQKYLLKENNESKFFVRPNEPT